MLLWFPLSFLGAIPAPACLLLFAGLDVERDWGTNVVRKLSALAGLLHTSGCSCHGGLLPFTKHRYICLQVLSTHQALLNSHGGIQSVTGTDGHIVQLSYKVHFIWISQSCLNGCRAVPCAVGQLHCHQLQG